MSARSRADSAHLSRRLGSLTTICVGIGVAIGSGIFFTPGIVAGHLQNAWWILGAWLVGGLFALSTSMVTAELATRCPEAGGEYVYLREAYGDGIAFFFGWGYTIFIAGGGVGVVASALGETIHGLVHVGRPELFAGLLVVLLTGFNMLGLAAGASLQNALGLAKCLGLAAIAIAALSSPGATSQSPLVEGSVSGFLAALPPILWSYEGSTDSAKLAEEITDVRRRLPRALISSALLLTLIYSTFNLACLHLLGAQGLANAKSPADVLVQQLFGDFGHAILSALLIVTLAGATSSSLLSTSRVTFAMARDGLAPGRFGQMSKAQAPVAALGLIGGLAFVFTQLHSFRSGIETYFIASAVLFGLSYGSLFIFRARESRAGVPQPDIFRCPLGIPIAAGLILFQLTIAYGIVRDDPKGGLSVLALMIGVSVLYRWVGPKLRGNV